MKTILTGIDFTKSSEQTFAYAAELAQKFKCKLLVFHIFETPVVHSNSGLFFISYHAEKKNNQLKLENFIQKHGSAFPGLKVEPLVISGSFKQEIKNLVAKHHIQYVVLGLVQKDKLTKFLYGSRSTDVAGKIDVPVIIVPDKFKFNPIDRLLIAVDNKAVLHKSTLKPFVKIAEATGSEIKVVHVLTPEEVFNPGFKPEIKIGKKSYPIEIVKAKELEAGIAQTSKDFQADLITIISRSHSVFYDMFFESNTKRIAFKSKVPVMAIHE